MKQNVEIMAYIFADTGGALRALRFVDGIQIRRSGQGAYEIESTEATLPEHFFSTNVAHVAAIVGTNSSGKSTALQDICRILTGRTPVTARHALVMRSDQGVYQLCSHSSLVKFDGQDIRDEDPRRNANLKVVFYAGGYDPLGRTKELTPRSAGVEFCDISDQFIYSSDPSRDFDYKLIYLNSLIRTGDPSLFLQADGARNRTIRFEAYAGYDVNVAARDFLEFTLTFSNDAAHSARLLELLNIPSEQIADVNDAIDRRLILNEKGAHFLEDNSHYFELLRAYLDSSLRDGLPMYPLQFALAIGRIAERLHAEPEDANLAEQMRSVHMDFPAVVGNILGDGFHSEMLLLYVAARSASPDTLSDDGLSISISLGGAPRETTYIQAMIKILLQWRSQGLEVSFRFTGISEGQRTLLTFYSRLFAQVTRTPHTGNTLLLIDEHEHGLHPEWQRRYLQELITLLNKDDFTSERYQVILSTHSPFLVSDLPGTHVNKIGSDVEDVTPTLAANLLELLLSPLFLENSTGEFSRTKITDMLDAIERAETVDSLAAASTLLPLLGDDLVRNYCTIRVKEKKRRLQARRA